jgi:hypothetical protein
MIESLYVYSLGKTAAMTETKTMANAWKVFFGSTCGGKCVMLRVSVVRLRVNVPEPHSLSSANRFPNTQRDLSSGGGQPID